MNIKKEYESWLVNARADADVVAVVFGIEKPLHLLIAQKKKRK